MADHPGRRATMNRTRVYSETAWESEVGACRALRAGPFVTIGGTAPIGSDGAIYAPGDAYAQARRCLEIIELALRGVGASRAHVVRTRMFVTEIDHWADFGRAHREFFGDSPPATTMVEVRRLVADEVLIEIECDAICDDM